MNRPKVWVYPRDQQWFGEIHRNPAMHGWVPVFNEEDAFISSLSLLTSSAICCHFCELPLPFNPLLCSLLMLIKFPLLQCSKFFSFSWSCRLSMSYRSFQNSLPANEVTSITLPAPTMFQTSKFLAKLTDLGPVTRIGNPAEQYINCC